MAAYLDRIERLNLLLTVIPSSGNGDDLPSAPYLLQRLGEHYAHLASSDSRLRAIQRDLKYMTETDRIEVMDSAAKPLRYRRKRTADGDGPGMQEYTRKVLQAVIGESLPTRYLERIWPRLLDDNDGVGLTGDKLRVISDTLRLTPAAIKNRVLASVLEALSLSLTLRVSYRDAKGKLSQPLLHPQGLLQRGPRVYLYAIKHGELETIRMYALHRMIRADVEADAALRAEDFDLQRQIEAGYADFSRGQVLNLKMRARGYIADLLRDCPINETQRIDEEAEGSPFEMVVHATLPDTGQLLRWLLGCGNNVQVLAPEDLCRVMAAQAAKMVSLYAIPHVVDARADTGTDAVNDSHV